MTEEEKLVQEIIDAISEALKRNDLLSGDGMSAEILLSTKYKKIFFDNTEQIIQSSKGLREIRFKSSFSEDDPPYVYIENYSEFYETMVDACPILVGQYVETELASGILESWSTERVGDVIYCNLVLINDTVTKNLSIPRSTWIKVKK